MDAAVEVSRVVRQDVANGLSTDAGARRHLPVPSTLTVDVATVFPSSSRANLEGQSRVS